MMEEQNPDSQPQPDGVTQEALPIGFLESIYQGCVSTHRSISKCLDRFYLVVRSVNAVLTWVLFVLALLSGCLYFQFWKCYNVGFMLLHTLISLCLVPMRDKDTYWRLYRLCNRVLTHGQKIEERRRTIKYVREMEPLPVADDPAPICDPEDLSSERPTGDRPPIRRHPENGQQDEECVQTQLLYPGIDPETAVVDREETHIAKTNPDGTTEEIDTIREHIEYHGKKFQEKGADYIVRFTEEGVDEVKRFKLNHQDTIRNLIGTAEEGPIHKRLYTRIRHWDSDESLDDQPKWKKKLATGLHLGIQLLRFRVSIALLIGVLRRSIFIEDFGGWQLTVLIKGLWFHIPMLWIQFWFAIWKQIKLWYKLGCAQYYLWMLVLIVCGALLIELPFGFLQANLDKTWCSLVVDYEDIDRALCKVFSCETYDGKKSTAPLGVLE